MNESDSVQSLLGKKFTAAQPGWFSDAADLFVLLCSFILTTASIVHVILIFNLRGAFEWGPVPGGTLLILQRVIATLSLTITSAVIMVAGKRYVLFKLAGGIRSRRVAVYSYPSIGNVACYLAWHRLELPLLALLAVWALGWATGWTINDAWAMVPVVELLPVGVPFGPLDTLLAPGSLFVPASGLLSYVMASVCSHVAGIVGVIMIGGGAQPGSDPMGFLYYPPLPGHIPNSNFSLSTQLNGFNISMELLSSIPPTAQNLTCVGSTGFGFGTGQLWYGGGDNQTLSIIAPFPNSQSLYRLNATAVVFGGTLQATSSVTEFVPSGETWPNVMSDDRWAQEIANLVCNATYPAAGNCIGSSLLDFAYGLNDYYDLDVLGPDSSTVTGMYWGTALGMAMGAYSFATLAAVDSAMPTVAVTRNDVSQLTPSYGIYVLIANIVVSAVMLVVVVKLRMASRLDADFMDSTRLLLDPLKNPELFNASLNATINALGNPKMLVSEDNEFLLMEQASPEKAK